MIRHIKYNEISECVSVIRKSFKDVAGEFNITKENSPNYVLFSVDNEKLRAQFESGRLMFAALDNRHIIGYYSLVINNDECEISNLCVIPEYRHSGIGTMLLMHAVSLANVNKLKK